MEIDEAYNRLTENFDLDSLKDNKELFEQFKPVFEEIYIRLHRERLSGKGAGLLAILQKNKHITEAQSHELINYLLRDEGLIAKDLFEIYGRALARTEY